MATIERPSPDGIGRNIRAALAHADATIESAARDMGVSAKTLQRTICGSRDLRPHELTTLAEALSVPEAFILFGLAGCGARCEISHSALFDMETYRRPSPVVRSSAVAPGRKPRTMTMNEASAFAKVSRRTVERAIAAGDLRALRVGQRSIRILESDMWSWLGMAQDDAPVTPLANMPALLRLPDVAELLGIDPSRVIDLTEAYWRGDPDGLPGRRLDTRPRTLVYDRGEIEAWLDRRSRDSGAATTPKPPGRPT